MKYFTSLSLLFVFFNSYCQCPNLLVPVTTSGQIEYEGTVISVTSTGIASTGTNSYCGYPSPFDYWIGYGTGPSASGSFIFNFTPAVQSVTLNFSKIDNGPGSFFTPPFHEETQVFVNGNHYAIPNSGTQITGNGGILCEEPLATLTPEGNVAGHGGWKGTTITGEINTLEVFNNITEGTPGGSLFQLWLCGNTLSNESYPNENFNCELYIDSKRLNVNCAKISGQAQYEIFDLLGRKVTTGSINGKSFEINLEHLENGIYVISIIENDTLSYRKKFINK